MKWSKADVEVIRAELRRLRDVGKACGRRLRPDDVVAAAREESSVLHRFFEWDDAVAGAAWRNRQARTMLRRVRVVVREMPTEAPKIVRVAQREPDEIASIRVIAAPPPIVVTFTVCVEAGDGSDICVVCENPVAAGAAGTFAICRTCLDRIETRAARRALAVFAKTG